MPPRYAYWTIIAGGLPTAFRAAEREELLPTFQRIRERHPDAQMKWFARGKLWDSPEAARIRREDPRGRRPAGDTRPDERNRPRRPESSTRDRSWRPGGEHRDPRQKFVDAKKQQNAALRKDRWQRKNTAGVRNQGSGIRAVPGNRNQGDRNQGSRPQQQRRPWDRKPWTRGQSTEEPPEPKRPPGPNREPKPDEPREPIPPPRPDEPVVPPPGPPERGRRLPNRPFRPRGGFPKRPRR